MKNYYYSEKDNHGNAYYKISTKLHKPGLIKCLVEMLADRKVDFGYSHKKVQPGWIAVDTSSTETFVSGDLNISTSKEHIYSSFLTNFFFTCTKDKGAPYKLLWLSSLS